MNQPILPALRQMSDFERILQSPFETFVLLDVHLSQLKSIRQEAKHHGKRIFIHADLIHGLKPDDYGADFLCHDIRPDGIISTRANMIQKAKKKGIIAVQRMFLLDSIALEKSFALARTERPDYIEVLPGIIPDMVRRVQEETGIPIISGGLVETKQQVEAALEAGAVAITTSNRTLWESFQ